VKLTSLRTKPQASFRSTSTRLLPARSESSNSLGQLESDDFGVSDMDTSGHRSNPSRPLESVLCGPHSAAERPLRAPEGRQIAACEDMAQAIGAKHPRHGRIIDAITRVLTEHCEPMHAPDVYAGVEALLGEPVRWASIKATLAGNLDGPAPRFVKIARGRYGIPLPSEPALDRGARAPTRPTWAPKSAGRRPPT